MPAGWNSVPDVQNVVPDASPVEHELADRALAERRDAYATEARRFIDAALVVMRRTGSIDPQVRDVVREAGLSNQAFYKHFPSKDALLLAILADGQQRLVSYVSHRLTRVDEPHQQVRRWIEAVMEQARNSEAADATRPFAMNSSRLADRFPHETAASREQLVRTLRPAVLGAGGDERDTDLVHDLVLSRMNNALVQGRTPERKEVGHLVAFCLAAIDRSE
ncbi:MAG: putative transcriptional regulator, TetR family [Actinomycetia bacterium]|jgi:AcrR family transcriptional regulator|nr:putative transcriptional regulator, TetR family [Actinomycetes bacterium]